VGNRDRATHTPRIIRLIRVLAAEGPRKHPLGV